MAKRENSMHLLTVVEASKICGVTRATVWRWIKAGQLPAAITAGGHHRISQDSLQAFMARKKMHVQSRGNQTRKILAVDDDSSIQRFLIRLLTKKGYEIETVSDGFSAGLKTVQFQPHLMILDLFMPELDGFEVCRQVKENPDTHHIRVIAISGFDTDNNRDRILDIGADAFLPKPIDPDALISEIESLLGTRPAMPADTSN